MDEEIFIPITMFLSLTAVFIVWFYLKFKTKLAAQKTIRLALEKGQELSPEFIKQLGEPEPPKDRDLRRGMIWLAIGIALAILGVAIGDQDAIGPMIGSAAFPALIGIAYLVMWRYGARQ